MNWFRISERLSTKPLIMWHATIPRFAEEIDSSGIIQPSSKLGQEYQGWSFSQGDGQKYGDGVYLAKTKSNAIYYAKIRLRTEWESAEDIEELYGEDMGFVALYKINIINKSKLTCVFDEIGRPQKEECMFLGAISKQLNQDAWFEGPQRISVEKELEQYIDRLEQANKEILGENNDQKLV